MRKVVLTELKHRPAEKEYHISFYDAKYDYFYVIDAVEGKVVTKDQTLDFFTRN